MESATKHKNSLHNSILQHDLFDAKFYRSNYGFSQKSDSWLLDHFCSKGLSLGWMPKPGFDPLLYRLSHPDCGENVIEHFVESGRKNRFYRSYREAFPLISESTGMAQLFERGKVNFDRTEFTKKNRANSRSMAEPVESAFEVGDRSYRFVAPEPDFVLQPLIKNEPQAIARLPHVFWDTICATETMTERIQEDERSKQFSSDLLTRMARRFSYEVLPKKSGLTENFHDDLFRLLAKPSRCKNLQVSVAFKGYPTYDHRLFFTVRDPGPIQNRRLNAFARCFDNAIPILDAMMWKNWVIAGAVTRLPQILQSHPVVLIGPEHVSKLKERWRLPCFERIAIPDLRAHELRYQLLDKCRLGIRNAIDQTQSRGFAQPVFLSQCGGTLATWLIIQLAHEFPDVFYYDLGQALDAWFLDTVPHSRGWTNVYAASIMENGFETYYRDLLGDQFTSFAASIQ